MNKRFTLLLSGMCFSSYLMAQQNAQQQADKKAVLQAQDDNAYTFSESQLGDENSDEGGSAVSFFSSNDDIYLSNVGYQFSPMRFRLRGYDSPYSSVSLNGLQMNDQETGRFIYGSLGGLNDITRNKDGYTSFERNNYSYAPIGGGQDINLRPASMAAGQKLTLSAGANRSYLGRLIYTYSSGLNQKGWAFTGSVGYRYGNDFLNNYEGNVFSSLGYFLGLQKVLNNRHSLSVVTYGSPTQSGRSTASTEEAYWLAGTHYYNPNWGYQNGKKRNARIATSLNPTVLATWDFTPNEKSKLVTTAGFRYSIYGNTALGWNGNAADPRPDYYQKFPSNAFNVYDGTKPTFDQLNTFNEAYNWWTSSKANRQINWDQMYFANAQANSLGQDALYYVESRHNDQRVLNLNSAWTQRINEQHNYTVGLSLSTTKGMHYKKMDDLLGAANYVDIDKFAARDNGYGSLMAQNDLQHPDRQIREGDKFGYNYNIYVNKASVFGQYQYSYENLVVNTSARIGGVWMWRKGLMQNGRAPQNSLGKSGTARFLEGGGKLNIQYRFNGNHSISLSAGYEMNAPLAYNSFTAPRIKNDFVRGLQDEGILNLEGSYRFNSRVFSGSITGYYTHFDNQVDMFAFYNDAESRFTYLAESDIEKEHYGVEAAFTLNFTPNFSMTAIGTVSNAEYLNNPKGELTYENQSESNQDIVYQKGLHVSGSPMNAVNVGFDYNINGWFFNVNGSYYDRSYIDFSPYRRLGKVMLATEKADSQDRNLVYRPTGIAPNGDYIYGDADPATVNAHGGMFMAGKEGNEVRAVKAIPQEKFKGGFQLNASIGRYIRLQHGRSLSINLSVYNILNNTDMKLWGFEQSRDDSYSDGTGRDYRFSKNSKYYYASGINAFLNIGLRF